MKRLAARNKPLVNYSEVARRLGIHPSYVSKLMNGTRVSVRRMKQIDDLLHKEFRAARGDGR